MSRRTTRGRGKNKEFKNYLKQNKKMNITIVILILVIVCSVVSYILIKANQDRKVAIEKDRISMQQSDIFKSANEELGSLDDYKSNSLIRISAVGDILCGNNLEQYGIPYDSIFTDLKKKLKNTDLTLGTYETNVQASKSDFATSIKNAGINFVSLAHNHALDYGEDDLNETNVYLNNLGIKTVGIYAESSENIVKIFEKKGAKVALLAYTYENGKQGVNIYDEEMVKADLEYANQNSNFSIVMMHWGEVYSNEISEEQKSQAEFLIDNGADVIIGAHPSVVQKMEVVKNKDGEDCYIGYSLGDFTSDFENEDSNLELILNLQVYVDTDGKATLYKVDYTPVYMIDYGKEYTENRFKILDMKAEIANYGEDQNSVTENIYNKLVRAVDKLNSIIIKQE